MPILLIAISLVATIAVFWQTSGVTSDSFTSAFLKALILHGVFIAVFTEELSLTESLSFEFVAFGWSLFALLNCGILCFWMYRSQRRINLNEIYKKIDRNLREQSIFNQIAITVVALILSICLLVGLISPPTNYDSMAYHLPRVMHWIQNRSIAHYPTNDLRQISFPPGAGYIITHLQVLSGSDRFANLVQWFAFLGCILGTSSIAKFVGGSQAIAAFLCATIPMAVLQSTTTQTDLTVSFWLVCFAYFIFRTPRYSKLDLFWLSASLGLGILTKPTAIIFGFPLAIVLLVRIFNCFSEGRSYLKRTLKAMTVAGSIFAIAIGFSLPTYWRNYQTFNNVLGDDLGTRNEVIGLTELISNILRNLALIIPINDFWVFLEDFHENILKIDVNHPDITLGGTVFAPLFAWPMLTPNEDFAANPVHFLLGCMAIVFLIYAITKKNGNLTEVLTLAAANVAGFLLFCLLIKWQIWGNRLMLPAFILATPVTGYFVTYCLSKAMQRTLLLLLASVAIIYSLTSVYRPLIPLPSAWTNVNPQSILFAQRKSLYFKGYNKQLEKYTAFADRVSNENCKRIGLSLGKNGLEYPLWDILAERGLQDFKLKHLNVNNKSKFLPPEFPDSEICAIFKS